MKRKPLSDFLKETREQQGRSQSEVSSLMGIGGAYQKLENGTTPIRPWQFILFCESLNVSIQDALRQCIDIDCFNADLLREHMKRAGIGPQKMAARLKTKPAVIKYYLRGAVPSDERRAEMEDILGLRRDELLDSFLATARRLVNDKVDVRQFARPRKSSARATAKRKLTPSAPSRGAVDSRSVPESNGKFSSGLVGILCTSDSYEKIKDILLLLDPGHIVRTL